MSFMLFDQKYGYQWSIYPSISQAHLPEEVEVHPIPENAEWWNLLPNIPRNIFQKIQKSFQMI